MTERKYTSEQMAWHMTDPDYAGVLFTRGNNRVAVAGKGTRFALQTRTFPKGGECWAWTLYGYRSTLYKAALRYGPEFAQAVLDNVPESPRDALPEFQAAMRERSAAFLATDWTSCDYAWVLRAREYDAGVCDDAPVWREWLRLIVTPGRRGVSLQVKDGPSVWVTAVPAKSASKLRAALNADPVPVTATAANLLCDARAWHQRGVAGLGTPRNRRAR